MFPFLKNKDAKASGLIVKTVAPSQPAENIEEKEHLKKAYAALVLNAIQTQDAQALLEALECLFEALETEPHEEYPHNR